MKGIKILLLGFLVFLISCKSNNNSSGTIEKHYMLVKSVPAEEVLKKIPELAAYSELMKNSLKAKPPILKIEDKDLKDEKERKAQAIAIQNSDFIRDVYHPENGAALRNEIMSVRVADPSEIPSGVQCNPGDCYRVVMYNYYFNSSVVAIVDVAKGVVTNIKRIIDAEAEPNTRINELAIDIALSYDEVRNALKLSDNDIAINKSKLKITINKTKCERSKHMCIGPTFYNEDSKIVVWTIVDMTDWKLNGLAWAKTKNAENKITEMEVQNEFVMSHFCEMENDTSLGDWKIKYRIIGSDGLEVYDVKYKGNPVINSSKIVDWHVSYLNKPGVGYSDATGCPMFSAAAVVAFGGPFVEDLKDNNGKKTGKAFIQDFRSPIWPAMCNYRYQSRFEFYDDGKFRIMGVNHGKGCNDSAVYKPVFRIDLNLGNKAQFAEWNGSSWNTWGKENWTEQKKSKLTKEGYWFKMTDDKNKGYYLIPDYGQYGKSGRGDNAFVYVSKNKNLPEEGTEDMVTIGECCRYDYKQGPEKFLIPAENIDGEKLILWYVPMMYNDRRPGHEYCWAYMVPNDGKLEVKTWPGNIGPMFVPIN